MNSILTGIAEYKKQEIAKSKQLHPVTSLEQNLPIRDFIKSLRSPQPAIIAEIKKASPSKGLIRKDFNVAEIAKAYAENGASCLSVLTDIAFFQGSPDNIAIAKHHCQLPVLRKDFIIDSYQIYESKSLGADCILLIVALLDNYQLKDYCQLAQELGMAVLVESHTQTELEQAIELPTPLIGINNRDLHSFDVDINLSVTLKSLIPDNKIVICESGINTRQDIQFLQSQGIHTFLIGESLMRASDIGHALKEILSLKN